MTEKWYRFDGGPITRWGCATEEQAKAYVGMCAKRYPEATCTVVAGEPEDEGCTIVNVATILDAAGIHVPAGAGTIAVADMSGFDTTNPAAGNSAGALLGGDHG